MLGRLARWAAMARGLSGHGARAERPRRAGWAATACGVGSDGAREGTVGWSTVACKGQGSRPRSRWVGSPGRKCALQPFSQKSHARALPKEFPIGLYDPAEADLELFRNSWSAGLLGERLYLSVCLLPPTTVAAGTRLDAVRAIASGSVPLTVRAHMASTAAATGRWTPPRECRRRPRCYRPLP